MSLITSVIVVLVIALGGAIIGQYLWEQYVSGGARTKIGLFKQSEGEARPYVRQLRGDKPRWRLRIKGEEWDGIVLEERKSKTLNPYFVAMYRGPTDTIETITFREDEYNPYKCYRTLAGKVDIFDIPGPEGLSADSRTIINLRKQLGIALNYIDKYEHQLRISRQDSAVSQIKQNERETAVRSSGSMGAQGRYFERDDENE